MNFGGSAPSFYLSRRSDGHSETPHPRTTETGGVPHPALSTSALEGGDPRPGSVPPSPRGPDTPGLHDQTSPLPTTLGPRERRRRRFGVVWDGVVTAKGLEGLRNGIPQGHRTSVVRTPTCNRSDRLGWVPTSSGDDQRRSCDLRSGAPNLLGTPPVCRVRRLVPRVRTPPRNPVRVVQVCGAHKRHKHRWFMAFDPSKFVVCK